MPAFVMAMLMRQKFALRRDGSMHVRKRPAMHSMQARDFTVVSNGVRQVVHRAMCANTDVDSALRRRGCHQAHQTLTAGDNCVMCVMLHVH